MRQQAVTREKKNILTLENKLKVLKELDSGLSERSIAAAFGISRSQVNRIRNRKLEIETCNKENLFRPVAKVLVSKAQYPEIDKSVYEWVREMRNPTLRLKPLPLSRLHIQARATHEAKIRGITNFEASNGWFRGWRFRMGVGPSLRLWGEAGDVNKAEIEPIMQELRLKLERYNPANIFNADETGLYFRALPARTYIVDEDEDRRTLRGSKSLTAKDRVTLLLCVNAPGTCKIEPLLVGSAKNPHCFRDMPSPVPYASQSNSWVDRVVYKHWWYEIFLPAVRKWTNEPAALLVDNCSGHDPSCVDPLGQVSIFYFPPNVTSVYQPLDQGIIAAFKTNYKREMITKLVEAYAQGENIQEEARNAKRGRKGLRYGCSATLLDAGNIVKMCWDSMLPSSIAGCWRHSNCLPHLPDEYGGSSSTHKKKHTLEIFETFSSLVQSGNLKAAGLEVIEEIVQDSKTKSKQGLNDIERWLNLETEPDMIATENHQLESDISSEFDSAAIFNESDLSICDNLNSTMLSPIPPTVTYSCVDENDLKVKLLKYANATIKAKVSDPVLIHIVTQLKLHLTQ